VKRTIYTSKNDNCYCTGTTKVAVKVAEKMPEEESLEATSEKRHRLQIWHLGADCSKYGQQQQGRPGRRWWTAHSLYEHF